MMEVTNHPQVIDFIGQTTRSERMTGHMLWMADKEQVLFRENAVNIMLLDNLQKTENCRLDEV